MLDPPLALALAIAGGLLLAASIAGLVRQVRRSVVERFELASATVFRVDEPGPHELHLEAFGLRAKPPLELVIHDRSMGGRVETRPIRLPSRLKGRRRTRLSLLAFDLDHRGAYELSVDGLSAIEEPERWAVVVTRPVRGRIVGWILAIVASHLLLLWGLVAALPPA